MFSSSRHWGVLMLRFQIRTKLTHTVLSKVYILNLVVLVHAAIYNIILRRRSLQRGVHHSYNRRYFSEGKFARLGVLL